MARLARCKSVLDVAPALTTVSTLVLGFVGIEWGKFYLRMMATNNNAALMIMLQVPASALTALLD